MSHELLIAPRRAPVRGAVAGVLETHRRTLDTIVARAEGPALLAVLRAAEDDLRRRLLVAYARGLGDAWTGAQLSATRTLVVDAIRHVQGDLRRLLGAGSRQLADQGLRNVLEVLRLQEQRFSGVVRPLQLEQALRFEHTLHGVLASRLRQYEASISRYGTRMIGELERAMQVGIVTRKSLGQMVDALAGHGGPGGLFRERRYFAARIVRTEMLASYNLGAQAAIEVEVEDFPDLQRKILAHHDRRTAPDSIFVDGEVRDVKEFFVDGAGRRYLVPPARPNDREYLIPWRKGW